MNAFLWLCYWLFAIPAIPWLLGVRYFSVYDTYHGTLMDELRYLFIDYPTYLFDREE